MTSPHKQLNPYAPTGTTADDAFDPLPAFGSPQAMTRVAIGLSFVYWGIGSILLSVIGAGALIPLVMRFADLRVVAAIGVLLGLGMMVGVVLGLIGRVFCLAVPKASQARGLIYAAVVFDLAALITWATPWIGALPTRSRSLTNLLSLIATVLFVFFLKRLAAHVQRPDLEGDAKSLFVMGITLFLFGIAVAVGIFLFGRVAGLLGVAVLIILVFMLLRYIRLLSNLRRAILGRI